MTKTPKAFNQVIGNVAAIERIKREVADNNGLGGCVFFLQGETGNGKTMIANIIADIADGDVYPRLLYCPLFSYNDPHDVTPNRLHLRRI